MLVLSRQKDESIIIGDGDKIVEVMIVDVRGDKVRLGIVAPKDLSVHRREVFEAIQREKEERRQEEERFGKKEEPKPKKTGFWKRD